MRLSLPLAALALGLLLATPAAAQGVHVLSKLGGKCLDVEGGGSQNGARVIGYACNPGAANQLWTIASDGTVRQRGKCLTMGTESLMLWDCQRGATTQRFNLSGGRLTQGNKCVDLKGGAAHWLGNQPALLWDCHGGTNQQWFPAVHVPRSRVQGGKVVQAGQLGDIRPVPGVVAAGSGNVVAPGGGNVVAPGGGNVIAAGGGNVVAAGGGNVLVPVSGVVAGGGGN